jgi:hypothetical protein
MFAARLGKMRQDHESPLLLALPGPFRQQDFYRIADGGFIRSAGGHRDDDPPSVAQEGDVSQDVLAILRTHAHQILAITTGFLRSPGRAPIKIANVGHQLAPLAGKQVDDVHTFCCAFEHG